MFLGELQFSIQRIAGVGPAMADILHSMGISNMAQLIRHYPRRYEDRKTPLDLAHSSPATPALTVATVMAHEYIHRRKGKTLKVLVADESATAAMLCYGRNFLASKLAVGTKINLYGPFEANRFGEIQSGSFVFEPRDLEFQSREFGLILPVYALSSGMTQGMMRNAISWALKTYSATIRNELPLDLPRKIASRNRIDLPKEIPSKAECLNSIHFPPDMEDARRARETLIFEELFHLQLTATRRRALIHSAGSEANPWSEVLQEKLLKELPFELTDDQRRVIEEIKSDIMSVHTMSRLVQGEVGSGKTLVAFMAALGVMGTGRQVAFMAPTELLSRQHADKAAELLEPLGVNVAFLSSDVSPALRKQSTKMLKSGEVHLAIGTHALFSQDLVFKDLGLAIIDEQQRFGVEQRLQLTQKGDRVDLLALTATPIPRTLALTAFGDMDISSIRTMPRGRLAVKTHLARMGNEGKVYNFVLGELRAGNQAYFVYPLIEESSKSKLRDARNMHEHLSREIFTDFKVALLHSKIDESEKNRVMDDFRSGKIQVLVATSVVEVGVDVPQATCIVIEHSERFGLSALHQLRGRVGRSDRQSFCFLVYAEPLSPEGKRRLMMMKKSHDGFVLAEEDLKMRGPGDMAGMRQSGFLALSIADPVRDMAVLVEARELAGEYLGEDLQMDGENMRDVRELFETVPPFDDNWLRIG